MKKKRVKAVAVDSRPLPVGYLLIGFFLIVAGVLFWGTGHLEATWAVLAVIFGGILLIASFRSLRM